MSQNILSAEKRLNDKLWEDIRTRVRDAGLQIVTFEELEPLLRDKSTHVDQIMVQKGYGTLKTNVDLDEFIADQLEGCKKIKTEYGTDVCISEIAMTACIEQAPDSVGIYAKE